MATGTGARNKMAKSLEWELRREENYRRFYRDSAGLSTSFEKDAQKKKELLIKYFPKRFGEGGSQDLRNYEPMKIGAIFSYLLTYARKYVR